MQIFSGLRFCTTTNITREHCPLVSQALCLAELATCPFLPLFFLLFIHCSESQAVVQRHKSAEGIERIVSFPMWNFLQSGNNCHGCENNLPKVLKARISSLQVG